MKLKIFMGVKIRYIFLLFSLIFFKLPRTVIIRA